MSFTARVFRILIASPSDVSEERDIAVSIIQAWNDLNSAERQIVLLPLRWETHSAPEYGRRPQEVINRQVVDQSDLLVGIFWTRVGSPTGVADSGTLEEIERVATQGKPVMLYFSQVKQDPDRIEIEQLRRLRDFKTKTFPKALVETYTTQIEFRDKLAKQLEIQLRTLLSEVNLAEAIDLKSSPTTEIKFQFADAQTGAALGSSIEIETGVIHIDDINKIPDFSKSPVAKNAISETGERSVNELLLFQNLNKDYYREMAEYLVRQSFFRPVRFWLKNVGGVGARDVYVDIRVTSDDPNLVVVSLDKAGLSFPRKSGLFLYSSSWLSTGLETELEQLGNQWTINFELRALQPQREVIPPPKVALGAKKTSIITFSARIYADTLPEPVTQTLKIDWTVSEYQKKASELLREAGVAFD